jgi:uncharacterized coiled-coil protein SlyX
MSRITFQERLEAAERRITEGERSIARQEQIIAKLDSTGRSTETARMVLATLRKTQRLHIRDRDSILRGQQAAPSL